MAVEKENKSLVRFFVACQIVGWVGMTLVLLTALASPYVRERRHPTWFNLCIAWIISCISYLLLSFAGQQFGQPPSQGLCAVHAALIYSVPSLAAWSTAALVIQLWFNIKEMFATKHVTLAHRRFKIFLLLAVPHVINLVLFLVSLAVALHNPGHVKRAESGVYCIITTGIPGRTCSALVALAMVVTVAFEAMVITILYRNRGHWTQNYWTNSKNIGTMIRVAIFSLFGIMSIAISSICLTDLDSTVPNVFLAITPVVAMLVFSSQSDLLTVWMFWKKGPYDALDFRPAQAEYSNQ